MEEKIVEKPAEPTPAPEQAPPQPIDEEKKIEDAPEAPKDEPKEEPAEATPAEEESTPAPEGDVKETEEGATEEKKEVENPEEEDARIQSDFNCCGITLQA